MSNSEVLKILAICGLNCGKCQAYAEGDIKKHATELKRLLGSFDKYAERFSRFFPVFNNYPSFKGVTPCGLATGFLTKEMVF